MKYDDELIGRAAEHGPASLLRPFAAIMGSAVVLVSLGAVAFGVSSLQAQIPNAPLPPPRTAPVPAAGPARPTIQDALLQAFSFPFEEETTLDQVCKLLQERLKAPVVLDRAALERKKVKGSTTVVLKLEGVRLKTGLKLLLDQAGLTYRIVPEDNLLVITDEQGSIDPIDQLASEMKAVHDEIHILQRSVDDLRDLLDPVAVEEMNPEIRNPTLQDDKPAEPPAKSKPHEGGSSRSRPGA